MPDLRNSTALGQLADLVYEPDPPTWDWAVSRLEPGGRLLVPIEARAALGARSGSRADVWGLCRGVTLLLSVEGRGRRITVDGRGRLYVPAWLRPGARTWLLVGSRAAASIVVVAPLSVLDGLGDRLAGEAG